MGLRSALGAPIIVEGRLWGALTVGVTAELLLPPETETRLGEFTELFATAIANTESRARADRLAEEQAALRRVATLVARQAPQTEVFNAIAEECGRLFGTSAVEMFRFEGDSAVDVASTGLFRATFSLGSQHALGGENVTTRIPRTGRAARIDDYRAASGSIGGVVIALGIRSAVGAPIIVQGQVWGALIIGVTVVAPPPGTEDRLAEFTELMATAIANTESRTRADRLTEEQAALRRVATLVARQAPQTEIFDAIAEECAVLFGTPFIEMIRYDGGSMVVVANTGAGTLPAADLSSSSPMSGIARCGPGTPRCRLST